MPRVDPDFPFDFSIDRTETGYRLSAPGAAVGEIEAQTIDELIGKLVRVVLRTVEDAEGTKPPGRPDEAVALRKLPATTLDRHFLEALARKYKAPREWGEEPDRADAL